MHALHQNTHTYTNAQLFFSGNIVVALCVCLSFLSFRGCWLFQADVIKQHTLLLYGDSNKK